MLFKIQAYLEDFLNKRNLRDSDSYAVRLANLYFYERSDLEFEKFLSRARKINTVLFENNGINNRNEFENKLIRRLDRKFKKKLLVDNPFFPGGTEDERKKLNHVPRLTVDSLIQEFKHATESRAIDAFWKSRRKEILRSQPEKIAQSLFAVFTKGVLRDKGIILREVNSGIGFVDIGIVISSVLHLIEIKILIDKFEGVEQLEQYMETEKRKNASLVVIDAINPKRKLMLPSIFKTRSGVIKVYMININPFAPSRIS